MNLIKKKSLKQLLWVGIGSIIMFFAGLTSAYIVRKAEGNWIDFLFPDWFLFSTIVIIMSSITLFIAQGNIKQERDSFSFVLATFFLGILFSFFQFKGWQELTAQGVFLTGVGSNVSGSFLYVITLAHLVHLVGGLVAILITLINIKKKKYNKDNYLGLELMSIYWHFLALLWLYLFVFLKYF